MMKKAVIIIIAAVLLLLSVLLWNFYHSLIPSDFDRAIYTVIIHNPTDIPIDAVSVLYGKDVNVSSTVVEYTNVTDIHPSEFRKINIATHNPSKEADVPYNVFVRLIQGEFVNTYTAGYFGIDTGGLAIFKAKAVDGKMTLNRLSERDNLYRKIRNRHYRNQQETEWE